MLLNYGRDEVAGEDKALPSILAAGAAMAGKKMVVVVVVVTWCCRYRRHYCRCHHAPPLTHAPALGYEGGTGGDDILAYVKALRQQHRDGLL